MPTAGDEGYETMVICPFDKSHEIRKGRMQFHLDKCRKNFPDSEMIRCPFNSTHLIAKCEKEFHTREECVSRCNFDRNYIQYGDESPVANLVPVHAGTIPDGDENWEDEVQSTSVLNTIQTEAANKKIMRMMQCESKAKRKNFRKEEKKRHEDLDDLSNKGKEEKKRHEDLSNISVPAMGEAAASSMYQNQAPLPRPKNPTKIQVEEQDPAEVRAILQMAKLNVGETPAGAAALPSETSSLPDESSSENSRFEDAESGAMSYKAMLSQKKTPSGAAPTPSVSLGNRPSTAKSIAVSVGRAKNPKVQDNPALKSDGFLMISIPGSSQGRGKIRTDQ